MSYVDVLHAKINQQMLDDPEASKVAHLILDKLHHGFFSPQELVDSITQPYHGYSLEDSFIFGQIWSMIADGRVLLAEIPLGEMPKADKEWQENQKALDRNLKHIRGGSFDPKLVGSVNEPSPQIGDGYLSFEELVVSSMTMEKGECKETVPARSISLEIGSTQAATTFFHLAQGRAIARWPYQSRKIWILIHFGEWKYTHAVRPDG